jgi:hypothetical protein
VQQARATTGFWAGWSCFASVLPLMIIFGLGARQIVLWSRSPWEEVGDARLAHDPARLVGPVVPRPAHGEEALIPDDLRDDLEADPDEALGYFGGMDPGMPHVADLQGGPGGNWIVSMMTRPPVVAMVVRAQPGSPGGPGGHWKSERADPGTLMIGA